MRQFRPSTRLLYLLALFQLVGGPLVLLTVVVFSKLVVRHSAEGHGVTVLGVKRALQSPEWQALADVLTGVRSGVPDSGSPEPRKAPQVKEPSGKLLMIQWEGLSTPLRELAARVSLFPHLEHLIPAWPHAPPSPPPRAA